MMSKPEVPLKAPNENKESMGRPTDSPRHLGIFVDTPYQVVDTGQGDRSAVTPLTSRSCSSPAR